MTHIVDLSNVQNPDSSSLSTRTTIDMSVYDADISASLYGDSRIASSSILLTPQKTQIVLMNVAPSLPGTMYYTPVYAEQIRYSEWLKLNRQFNELVV